ncbi:DUF397 domain-containing protein [Streptomyces sp. NPDC057654]|uniref:DUF397 domain-containing protein n=1 Tax=Streptomyces sp. NPDC057654 TaxID=3346196 RepID=UPI003698143E
MSARSSSFSGDGGNNCVEVIAAGSGTVALRKSAAPAQLISTNRAALRALIRGIKAGEAQCRLSERYS